MHGTNGIPHSLPAPPTGGRAGQGAGRQERLRPGQPGVATMLPPAGPTIPQAPRPGASGPTVSLQVLEARACAQGAERGATVKSSNRDREDNAKTSERWPLCRLDGVGSASSLFLPRGWGLSTSKPAFRHRPKCYRR